MDDSESAPARQLGISPDFEYRDTDQVKRKLFDACDRIAEANVTYEAIKKALCNRTLNPSMSREAIDEWFAEHSTPRVPRSASCPKKSFAEEIYRLACSMFGFVIDGGDAFCHVFDRMGNVTKALMQKELPQLSKIGFEFVTAAHQSFRRAEDNFVDLLKKGLAEWLGLPPKLFEEFEFTSVVPFILQIIGYDWDSLLELVSEVFESNDELIVELFDQIRGFVEDAEGVGKWVQETLKNGLTLPDMCDLYDAIYEKANDVAMFEFVIALIDLGLLLLPQTGIYKAIKSLYKAGLWFITQAKRISGLLEKGVEVLETAINGIGGADLANRIYEFIERSVGLVITGLAAIFGLDSLPGAIRGALKSLKKKAQSAARKLLVRAQPLLDDLLNAAAARFGGPRSLVPGQRMGSLKVWIDKDAKVMMEASPGQEAIPELKRRRDDATSEKERQAGRAC